MNCYRSTEGTEKIKDDGNEQEVTEATEKGGDKHSSLLPLLSPVQN